MPNNRDFLKAAIEAGFDISKARFMDEWLAKHPHQHDIEDVEGLPETLAELGVTDAEEEDEEEEGEEEEIEEL